MTRYDAYMICTSPRSGSTLLCRLLAATGIAGKPDSHFHVPSLDAWSHSYRLSADPDLPEYERLAAIVRAALERGRGGTGVFGLRMQHNSLAFFLEKLAILHPGLPGDAARIEAAFGRTLFIHLSRKDKVAQAVSCVKARQTGLWHMAPDGTELERTSAHRNPVYDAAALRAQYQAMLAADLGWAEWFAAEGIEPMRISYDPLSADPHATLRLLLDRLGLDGNAAAGIRPGIARLSDATNRSWISRLRRELAPSENTA